MIDKILTIVFNVAFGVFIGMSAALTLGAPFIIWHFVGKYW